MKGPSYSFAIAVSIFVLTACAAKDDSQVAPVDALQNQLTQDFGGFTTADEQPAFGEADLTDAYQVAVLTAYLDPTASDPGVLVMQTEADTHAYVAYLAWGQMTVNPEFGEPQNWDGSLSIDDGALILLRTAGFEEAGQDEILGRGDPRVIAWKSMTGPHHDGMFIKILTKNPEAMLKFDTEPHLEEKPAADWAARKEEIPVDDAGNKVLVVSHERLPGECPRGFLGGRWHGLAKAEVPAGWFRGVFLSDEGELLGYLKGLYGAHPQSQEQLLFGKYIGLDGKFVGRLRGTYGEGVFGAEWLNREGTRGGKLGGRYVAGPLADVKAGFFNGGWIELCPEDASAGEP